MADEGGETATLPLDPLPLAGWHRAHGARMVPFAGYDMPIQYDGIMAEHHWTRSSASLFDVSHMGQLRVTGEGAGEALEAVLPGNIAGLGEGQVRYSLLLDDNGGVLDDLMVTRMADGYYLVVNGATKWDDIAHLIEHLPDEITLNHMTDHALLALQGPGAAGALAALLPGVEALFFMQAGAFAWQGHELWISRSGYTGEDGFEISVAADAVAQLADALLALDAVRPAGLGARDSLRLEAGLPLYGHDLDPLTDPISAGLGFAIPRARREQGAFIGHAALMERIASGPVRRRVGLLLDGRQPAREGATLLSGDREVGTVTSGGFSPTLERPIAMGYVTTDLAATGTLLEVEVRNKRLAAQVCALPFVPHRYHRKEG
ncbi:MAG: glycine cleavage system aminomethyltransferase GcvT [Novosphingobium sp.]|nr:glycine cleavage system aminomethyltransferase GcvT [Novosphingobium sp.]MCP5379159.1 glycine cleavage system aminomethyltransferase GcvT [Novosphingobium sp.]MCP5388955.1 glycine cleavage system aminomethyltransferase GcvT [Novosphingobium sp.]